MWAWLRGKGRVDYVIPPAEASVTQRLAELQSRQDAALRLIDGLCGSVPSEVQDALLEVRLVLRPAVPVAAGPENTVNNEEKP